MAEIMKANVAKTNAFHNLLQVFVYSHAAKVLPQFIGKYKVQLIVESLAST